MDLTTESLKTLLESRCVTYEEVSRAIGVSEAAVGTYARGEREPSLTTIVKLADYFGVSVDELLGAPSWKNSPENLLLELSRRGALDASEARFLLRYLSLPAEARDRYTRLSSDLAQAIHPAGRCPMDSRAEAVLREAAARALVEMGVSWLPVSMSLLCRRASIALCSYSHVMGKRRDAAKLAMERYPYFLRREGSAFVMYYDDRLPFDRLNFGLAVLMGHIRLGHLDGSSGATEDEKLMAGRLAAEAEGFALCFLAPASLLHRLGVASRVELRRYVVVPEDILERIYNELGVRASLPPGPWERQALAGFREFLLRERHGRIFSAPQ